MLDTYWHSNKDEGRLLLKNILLTLFVTFACERELETEQNCSILNPTLMAISVVSFSFSRATQPEALGISFLLSAGFLYHILSPTGLQTQSGVLRAPSAGCGFPTSNSSDLQLTDFLSTPSYIIVQSTSQSPTQSLEWHVWSSSSENNCHAVQRSLSSDASVYECIMGFYLVPFHQLNPPTRFLSITGHWNVSLPSGASLWNGMFGRVEGQYTSSGVRRPINECPRYNAKQFDGEVTVMLELWEM